MSSGPVLIVEDNIDILEAMQMAIEMEEVQVLTATNGQEALCAIRTGPKTFTYITGSHDAHNGWLDFR